MKVLMFHSIGNEESNWYRNWLSVSVEQFDYFCQYLSKKKYNTLFLDEWYDLHNSPSQITKKQIVLTFDDGYLDNWVYVFPIFKKYGLKGTIFINPEFVDPSECLRPNYDDVLKGNYAENDLTSLGFLNWNEIKKLDESPYFDIQSHSMSHNQYFYTDNVIDIYVGQDKYDWLSWFIKPERKPFYITDNLKRYVPMGYPVFKYKPALSVKRFFPSEQFIEYIIKEYKENPNYTQFKSQLSDIVQRFKNEYGALGRYEKEQEMERRYRYELFDSKRILEEKLNKKIDFLCWPSGGYNELSLKLSIEAGYKASTIASWDRESTFDNLKDYKRIRRMGMSSFLGYKKTTVRKNNRKFLVQNFLSNTGHVFFMNYLRVMKIPLLLKKILAL